MFNTSPQSFTSPPANPQTVPGDPKAAMPGFNPVQPQGFSFPQAQQRQPQRSPYPAPTPPPQFASPAPLQGGFFGGMNQRPPMGSPMAAPPATPGFSPRSPGMMPAPARMAQNMRGFGRGNDTMMMHVTPGEVQGLQALAQQYGGSLTTNPQTGLPEAGFLEDILPMLAGGLLTLIPGVGPLMAAGLVGGGTGLATGSLEKGLMAGLGAFGGASLGSALGAGASSGVASALPGAATETVAGAVPGATLESMVSGVPGVTSAGALGASPTAIAGAVPGTASSAIPGAVPGLAVQPSQSLASKLVTQGAVPGVADTGMAISTPTPGVLQNMFGQGMGDKIANFGREFGEAASGVKPGMTGPISPTRTGIAALGASAPFLQAMQPTYDTYKKEDDFNYEGPYTPTPRTPRFRGPNVNLGDSSEFSYFDNTNPYPGFQPAPRAFADGGEVAQTEDRALRMPAADYRAGMGAEHNYNFRPVNPAPGMQMGEAASPMRGGRQSFADRIARATGRGETDTTSAPNMRKYRYDSQTQSVIDDGTYSGMGGMGGMGGAGEPGGSLFPSGVNVSRFAAGGDVEPKFADKKIDGLAGMFVQRGGPPGSGGIMDFLRGLGFKLPNAQGYGSGGLDDGTTKEEYMKRLGMAAQPGGALAPSPQATGPGLASGGDVNLRDGSFVVDARTVSELGNGSSGAGQELLARHGGQPIMGPGDGVSDSIPANIGGRQRAKVARDEVKFDPEAVRRLGGGDLQRGAQKLYALMEKAQKARKAAGRGQDTKLRKKL